MSKIPLTECYNIRSPIIRSPTNRPVDQVIFLYSYEQMGQARQ